MDDLVSNIRIQHALKNVVFNFLKAAVEAPHESTFDLIRSIQAGAGLDTCMCGLCLKPGLAGQTDAHVPRAPPIQRTRPRSVRLSPWPSDAWLCESLQTSPPSAV